MLPTLWCLSVRRGPESRFRHWYSSRSLHISPLHREFCSPLPPSSLEVSDGVSQLSHEISPPTFQTAYTPFTPSKSGQRLHPTFYRSCWHVVSRCLFHGYRLCLPHEKRFTTRRPSSLTRRRCVRLSPIAQNSLLLPPVGVGAVSQSPSGWSSSQTSYPSSPWWAVTSPTS